MGVVPILIQILAAFAPLGLRIEFDHIVPFALGGEHSVENLRLRCFAHSQWHSIEEFGLGVLGFVGFSAASG